MCQQILCLESNLMMNIKFQGQKWRQELELWMKKVLTLITISVKVTTWFMKSLERGRKKKENEVISKKESKKAEEGWEDKEIKEGTTEEEAKEEDKNMMKKRKQESTKTER